jgi:electron transfer flavoprotein beta subunit
MKILVPVKRTLDANVKVRVAADNSGVDLTNAKMAMNPFCEIAVEEAVRLKEKGVATEVIVVTIGQDKAQDQLRSALATGADRGILVKSERELEPLNIAKILQKLVEKEQPGLIILGKQSIDSDNNQVGQMLSALCRYSLATFASKVSVEGDSVLVSREVDGGEQTLKLTLPAVITSDLRLNEPRYAKLPDIMQAKKKPVEILEAGSFGLNLSPRVNILSVASPAGRSGCEMLDSAAALVDKLRNQAKVI